MIGPTFIPSQRAVSAIARAWYRENVGKQICTRGSVKARHFPADVVIVPSALIVAARYG
jgi:hypothetical protein